ncbi:hypothetical protein CBS147330_9934 [Penicillium roqueforti]|nr:hypothetical protein CBS147330_9934 [Penicillium roqueforti]
MLEGAISSIAVNFANEQMTAASAADHKEKMLKNVRAITVDQIKGALRDILLPMFTPKTANLIVTYTTVLEDPHKGFEDDYSLKAGDQDKDKD